MEYALKRASYQPMRSWDDRTQRFSFTYDTLRRPVDRTVSVSGGSEKLLGRIVYGELLADPADTNHRGRVYRVYDGAGVATTIGFDFKGFPTAETRQLVDDETTQPDWTVLLGEDTVADMATAAASLLSAETFSASSERDALGRVLTAVSPDGSEVHYTYDEGGGLQKVELNHRGSPTTQTVVGDIRYDAKGRREQVVYGSTSSPTSTTTYTYDPLSQRLTRLRTVRESDDEAIQSLHYHYDPVGNITDIRDTAQQTVYFQNTVVEAANSYTYDALYRLVEATGREHSSEGTAQRTHADLTATAQPMTSDPSAMRRYTQQYVYDEVGNILQMQHIPSSGTGWTRYYEYDSQRNRLLATSAPGDNPQGPYSHEYDYDDHGNMIEMPHLSSMVWNHDDELQEVAVGSETLYFQYAGGIRSRKFVQKSGTTTEERIYLGHFEIYRKRINGTLDLERESLHVSDGSGRICLIETKTVENGTAVGTPTGIWRYQLSNHLGSAATEITPDGDVISYEEYHPYGTSAYRAVDASIDVSAKRYRYTGMERDDETGLAYHSARYYAIWLGRWTASDPIGLKGGENRFGYTGGNPIRLSDPSGTTPPQGEVFEPDEIFGTPDGTLLSPEGDLIPISTSEGLSAEDRQKIASYAARLEYGESVHSPDTAPATLAPDILPPIPPPVAPTDYGPIGRAREENLRWKSDQERHFHGRQPGSSKVGFTGMMFYAGLMMLPLAIGEAVVANTAAGVFFYGGAALYESDQMVAMGRQLGGDTDAKSGLHAVTKGIVEASGASERVAEQRANQVELAAAIVFLGGTLANSSLRPREYVAEGTEIGSYYGRSSAGAAQRHIGKVIQTGGKTIPKKTADALNKQTDSNILPRDWGRALEGLKTDQGLPPNHHGKITDLGFYLSEDGEVIGNIMDYLP